MTGLIEAVAGRPAAHEAPLVVVPDGPGNRHERCRSAASPQRTTRATLRVRASPVGSGASMFNFWTVMYLLFIGVVAGYAARFLVKGGDPMTWWQTILLGVVGSFVGGFGAVSALRVG